MLKTLLLGAVSGACLFTSTALAQVQTIYRSGGWETMAGVASDGRRMCAVSVHGTDRTLLIKWFEGRSPLFVHLFKAGWAIPTETIVRISFQFDQSPSWDATAAGIATAKGVMGNGLEFHVGDPQVPQFLDQLRFSSQMVVHFPDGSETPWTAYLMGSNAAVIRMAGCIQTVLHPPSATQPFMSQAQPPTQPFSGQAPAGRPPAPTEAVRPTTGSSI